MKKVIFVANSAWYLKNFRESTLVEFSKNYQTICVFPSGDHEHELEKSGLRCETVKLLSHSKNPLRELIALYSIFKCFYLNKPDVVFSFNPKTNLYSLICCYILRIQCVPNVSGVGAASQIKGITGWLYKKLCKFFFRQASYVFFQNKEDAALFKEQKMVPDSGAEVLPGSGVDLKKFTPSRIESQCKVFLMASRLIRAKGVVEYVDAARKISHDYEECEFLLAGVPDYSDRAVDISDLEDSEGRLPVDFLGHVKNIAKLLESVDCVILPSYYPEGTPRILIEAAASGKIILTTDTPGCRDLVDNGINGYLIPAKSSSELASAMEKIIKLSAGEAAKMKLASRDMAERLYDEDIVINKYLNLADNLV